MVRSLLITADELAGLIAARTSVRVLDVRWRLDRPDGRAEYIAGHIPGAVFVDLDQDLAAPPDPAHGRHPLPATHDLEAAARRWGIDDGDCVVVYDDLSSMSAARAWWVLTDAGLDVQILDGSLGAWTASGRPLDHGEVSPDAGTVTLGRGTLPVLSIDDAAALGESGILLDARAGERYRGEVEPIDPRAGHIPGARSAPTIQNVDADGHFLSPEVLRERFRAAGVTHDAPVGVYCGSGVTASHEIVALILAGFSPSLYAGSWSQWSSDATRELATDAGPGLPAR